MGSWSCVQELCKSFPVSLALHVPPMGIYQQGLAHYQTPEWGLEWLTMIPKGWEGPMEGPEENQSGSRGTWRAVAP